MQQNVLLACCLNRGTFHVELLKIAEYTRDFKALVSNTGKSLAASVKGYFR